MDMEVMLTDLGDKVPWLCPVLRPEYTPYLNTAGTVLLGWMVVCWISHIVWTLFAPLAISTIAVVIVCPSTVKWLVKRLGPNVENAFRHFLTKALYGRASMLKAQKGNSGQSIKSLKGKKLFPFKYDDEILWRFKSFSHSAE